MSRCSILDFKKLKTTNFPYYMIILAFIVPFKVGFQLPGVGEFLIRAYYFTTFIILWN